ncbi:hypothetical protein [Deinococcus sp. UR1]|uniref:hypothetical protein n=1 Tax=Deinococcus sp. UR1 TaxID=1704277 RepID=UPI000C174AAD|nr:hypothetical protein [Deinococcus sp. UR1]PIG96878.1 hypothetical protein AMD26_015225 [Deinococcus sp. UR1]
MPDLTGTHTEGFTPNVEAFNSLTPGHFSKFNDRAQILLNNDSYLNGKVNEVWTKLGALETRQGNTEQALANLTGRVGTLESSSGGGSGSTGMTQVFHDGTLTGDGTAGNPLSVVTGNLQIITTASDDWAPESYNSSTYVTTVMPPQLGPNTFAIPIGHANRAGGLPVTITGGYNIPDSNDGGSQLYHRNGIKFSCTTSNGFPPTQDASVTWLTVVQVPTGSSDADGRHTAAQFNDQVYISNDPYVYNGTKTYTVYRPATAPATGGSVRISGTTSYIGNTGHVYPYMDLVLINGGTRTPIGRTPNIAVGEENKPFSFTLPSAPAGTWQLECKYPVEPGSMGSGADAGVRYVMLIEYIE